MRSPKTTISDANDVMHNLAVKIFFLPTISNRNPKNKQLPTSENSVYAIILSS
jgi:hypothetical protein